MIDTRFLRASDGTGPAPIARINTARIIGATVYKVDTVNKWPSQAFIATVGTLNVNGYLDPTLAPINQFRGHLVGSDIVIDSWEPGSAFATADLGNAVNQYIILKQTTGTANLTQDSLAELQNEDILRTLQTTSDFVQAGGVWSIVSGLNGAMTAVTGYQAGLRATLAAVASRAFTVSKDTYVDLLRGGTIYAPTFTLVYTEQTNGGASPVLAANSIRLAKVITSAAAITSIVQAGNDSLGNQFYINAPSTLKVGYNMAAGCLNTSGGHSGFTSSTPSPLATNTYVPVTLYVPAGYKVKYHGKLRAGANSAGFFDTIMTLGVDGSPTVPAGSTDNTSMCTFNNNNGQTQAMAVAGFVAGLTAGLHTFSLYGSSTAGNGVNWGQCAIFFEVVPN